MRKRINVLKCVFGILLLLALPSKVFQYIVDGYVTTDIHPPIYEHGAYLIMGVYALLSIYGGYLIVDEIRRYRKRVRGS